MENCLLCNEDGGKILVKNKLFRIILANEPDYPGFIRIIANDHYTEMTDLDPADQLTIMTAVLQIESIVRKLYQPDKINLASFGNVVPHVHWHIIPRYLNDKHYPNPIWGSVTNSQYIPSDKLKQVEPQLTAKLTEIFSD